jgi:hypothetical protein
MNKKEVKKFLWDFNAPLGWCIEMKYPPCKSAYQTYYEKIQYYSKEEKQKIKNRNKTIFAATGNDAIYLNPDKFCIMDEDDLKNVLLHEIAHTVTRGHSHCKVWFDEAIKQGWSVEKEYALQQRDNNDIAKRMGLVDFTKYVELLSSECKCSLVLEKVK